MLIFYHYMLLNVENLIEKINEKLPPQIKVFDYVRTTNGFNCKNHCSGRTYLYILPTYALAPVEETCTLEYRTSVDILERMNEILEKYIGTHNFHNFTSGVKPHEASAKRYIKHFECRLPFVKDGVEFCVISVTGQSFMLHQIRKMIGLAIAVMKGFTNIETIDLAFQHEKVDVPIAPGLGLLLERLHYDQYNLKWASDGSHDKLDFTYIKDKVDAFKDEYIVSSIIKEEIETQSMMEWLPILHKHSYTTESNYDSRKFPSLNKKEKSDVTSDDNPASEAETGSLGVSSSDKTVTQSESGDHDTATVICSDSANQDCSKHKSENRQNECNTDISQTDCVQEYGDDTNTASENQSKTASSQS